MSTLFRAKCFTKLSPIMASSVWVIAEKTQLSVPNRSVQGVIHTFPPAISA